MGQGVQAVDAALVERALAVFARGFAFTRSMVYPCTAERVGRVWVVRDAERRKGEYRNEEWTAWGMEPGEVDRTARDGTRGRFAVCALAANGEDDRPVRAGYKALGYRLGRTEPLMVQRLESVPRWAPPAGVTIERVLTAELAERFGKAERRKPLGDEWLRADAPLRQYVAEADGKIVGWVRSIVVEGEGGASGWCAGMYVRPAYRRRGIARALMARMLAEDKAGGATLAVLLASHTGAMLYPVVGYEQIGTLLVLTPKRG